MFQITWKLHIGGVDSILGTDAGTYHWVDGSPVVPDGINRWSPSDPGHKTEDYMVFGHLPGDGWVWMDVVGNLKYAYLCQAPVF